MTECRLRGFKDEDVETIHHLWDDPNTALLIGNRISLLSRRSIISHFSDSNSSAKRVIIADKGDQAIGYAIYQNLCPISRTYRIGLSLLPSVRGRGLGSISLNLLESFLINQWMAHKLQAEVLSTNEPSKRLFSNSNHLKGV